MVRGGAHCVYLLLLWPQHTAERDLGSFTSIFKEIQPFLMFILNIMRGMRAWFQYG